MSGLNVFPTFISDINFVIPAVIDNACRHKQLSLPRIVIVEPFAINR